MTAQQMKPDTRRASRAVEREVEIAAPVAAVWKALTDAKELTRWFPLDARVTPGEGGEVWMSWQGHYEGGSQIDVWQPERHLRIAFPAEGPGPLLTDYYLEGRGGRTVLRVVTSGFGGGADWDELYHGVSHGWDFELRALRHYLERHRGRNRAVAFVTAPYPDAGRDAAWQRLTAPGGLFGAEGLGRVTEGGQVTLRAAGDVDLSGRVELWRPPSMLVLTVDAWNDALFRMELEGQAGVWLWFATWDVPEERVRAVERAWRDAVPAMLG